MSPTERVEARTAGSNTDSVLARVVAPTWWIAPCTESELESRVLSPTESVEASTVADATDSVLARVVAPT